MPNTKDSVPIDGQSSIKVDYALYERFRDKVHAEGRKVKWVVEMLMERYVKDGKV